MDRLFAFDAGRPGVGTIWITLLRFFLCFGFWVYRIMLDGMDWVLVGFGFEFGIWIWLDMLVEWIRSRYWKESRWQWIWNNAYKAVTTYVGQTTGPTTADWIIGVVWALIAYWVSFFDDPTPGQSNGFFTRDVSGLSGILLLCLVSWGLSLSFMKSVFLPNLEGLGYIGALVVLLVFGILAPPLFVLRIVVVKWLPVLRRQLFKLRLSHSSRAWFDARDWYGPENIVGFSVLLLLHLIVVSSFDFRIIPLFQPANTSDDFTLKVLATAVIGFILESSWVNADRPAYDPTRLSHRGVTRTPTAGVSNTQVPLACLPLLFLSCAPETAMTSTPPKTVVVLGARSTSTRVIAAELPEGRRLVGDRSSYVSLSSLTVPAQKAPTGPGFEPENALITPHV
ncbi:hypothetical protein B0H13DRAFT_2286496 [Mycena leptocephala]|nr:hypothetical protein B0H13DRAFT_2286496 [Mycena leptocephala]